MLSKPSASGQAGSTSQKEMCTHQWHQGASHVLTLTPSAAAASSRFATGISCWTCTSARNTAQTRSRGGASTHQNKIGLSREGHGPPGGLGFRECECNKGPTVLT